VTRRYRIDFKPSAAKALKTLPKKHQQQIQEAIEGLTSDPRPFGVEKMKGETNMYRIYTGVYRVIYDIYDSAVTVLVLRIGHRNAEDFMRSAPRPMA
jgi:mRNA interferase RelE/StbE